MSVPSFWIQRGEEESLPWGNSDSLPLSVRAGATAWKAPETNGEGLSGSIQSSRVPGSRVTLLSLPWPLHSDSFPIEDLLSAHPKTGVVDAVQVSHQSFMRRIGAGASWLFHPAWELQPAYLIRSFKAINRLWNPTDMGSETCTVTLRKSHKPSKLSFLKFNMDILLLLYGTDKRVNI